MAPFIFRAALRRFVGGSSRLCPRRCAGVCRGVPALSRFALVSGFLPAAWPVPRRRMLSSEPPNGPRGGSVCLDGRTRLRAKPGMVHLRLPGFRMRRFQFSLQRLPVAFLADHQGLAVYDRPFASPSMQAADFTRQHTLFLRRKSSLDYRRRPVCGSMPGRRLPLPGFRRLRGGAGGSRAARRRLLPPLFLVQKILQDSGPAGMAQLPDGLRLDLPDSLPGHPEHAAHFLQRLRPAVGQPEP